MNTCDKIRVGKSSDNKPLNTLHIRMDGQSRDQMVNQIFFKVWEKSGSFVSGQGIFKALYKVSEKYGP